MPQPHTDRLRLALDVNFPEPILAAFDEFLVDIELVPVRHIDDRLPNLDDRDLVIALRQEGFDWLVTNNYKMLRNPMELAAILKSRMNVFAIEAAGHDPLKASGALLLDLPAAIRRATGSSQPTVFWTRPRSPKPHKPWALFETAAERHHERPGALYDRVKVTDEEAAAPWPTKVIED